MGFCEKSQELRKTGFPKEGNPVFLQMYGQLHCLRLAYKYLRMLSSVA